jgi:hypothetical protein
MHRIIVILSSVGMFAACAAAVANRTQSADNYARNSAKIAAELQGLTPSPPQDCIDSRRLRNAVGEPYGATVLYRVGSNLVYRNDTSGGCLGLDRGETLIDKSYPPNQSSSAQMCRGDVLYAGTVRTHMLSGSCTRGAWVAYTR